MKELDTQMYMALQTYVMFVGDDFTMKEFLTQGLGGDLIPDLIPQGIIFGWLAAKDMWHNDVDVNSFLENLREEHK